MTTSSVIPSDDVQPDDHARQENARPDRNRNPSHNGKASQTGNPGHNGKASHNGDPGHNGAFHNVASGNGGPIDLVGAYAELQDLLLDSADVGEFLHEVAILSAEVADPPACCGITMRRDHELHTVASSDQLAERADEIQYGQDQGPCLQALRSNEIVHVPDLDNEYRWGDYRVYAQGQGIRSSLSLPLNVRGSTIGALNLYSTEPHVFGTGEIERLATFARQAAAALTLLVRHVEQQTLSDQLRAALASRATIDQAMGMIMAQQRCTASEAFAVLRKASQHRNRKVSDIAAELIRVNTGQSAQPAAPFTDPQ